MSRNDSQKQVVDFEEGEGATSRFKSFLDKDNKDKKTNGGRFS